MRLEELSDDADIDGYLSKDIKGLSIGKGSLLDWIATNCSRNCQLKIVGKPSGGQGDQDIFSRRLFAAQSWRYRLIRDW